MLITLGSGDVPRCHTLQFAPPLKMSDYAFEAARPAPMAGEHSEEILREAGYGDAEIKRLRSEGVI